MRDDSEKAAERCNSIGEHVEERNSHSARQQTRSSSPPRVVGSTYGSVVRVVEIANGDGAPN